MAAVENRFFSVERPIWTIHILRSIVYEGPSSESHDPPLAVLDGEHHAVPKTITDALITNLSLNPKTCSQNFASAAPHFQERFVCLSKGIRRIADAEHFRFFCRYATILKILLHMFRVP